MDADWLKAQFDANPDRSKAELAAALNLGASAISKILTGQRQIKAPEYAAMRRFFGLSVTADDDIGARRSKGSYTLKPLTQLRESGAAPELENWVMPAGLMQAHTKTPENIRVFTVPDNAMLPDFRAGEWVLVDIADNKPSPAGVFVVEDGFSFNLRHVEFVPHSAPPAVRVSARQPGFAAHEFPLDKVTLPGRVVAKLQWL